MKGGIYLNPPKVRPISLSRDDQFIMLALDDLSGV
jgi:hypothetical protein